MRRGRRFLREREAVGKSKAVGGRSRWNKMEEERKVKERFLKNNILLL